MTGGMDFVTESLASALQFVTTTAQTRASAKFLARHQVTTGPQAFSARRSLANCTTRMYLIYTSPKLQATQMPRIRFRNSRSTRFRPTSRRCKRSTRSSLQATNCATCYPSSTIRSTILEYASRTLEHNFAASSAEAKTCLCPWPKGALDNCYSPSEARIMQNKMWCGYCAQVLAQMQQVIHNRLLPTRRVGVRRTHRTSSEILTTAPKSGAAQCAICECPTGYGCPAASISAKDNCVECAAASIRVKAPLNPRSRLLRRLRVPSRPGFAKDGPSNVQLCRLPGR